MHYSEVRLLYPWSIEYYWSQFYPLNCLGNNVFKFVSLLLAMCELGVESVETLFLALPEMSGEDAFEVLKGFWEVRLTLFTLLLKLHDYNTQ